MVSNQHVVAWAAESRWRWLAMCWRLRRAVAEVAAPAKPPCPDKDLGQARDVNYRLAVEMAALQGRLEKEERDCQQARAANAALVRFIHSRHRLNVPFDPETIRGLLQKADQR